MRSLLVMFVGAVTAFGSELPSELAALKAKRDAKVAEIDRVYAAELEKLQKRMMQAGNLKAANEVEEEIARVVPNPFLAGDDALRSSLEGTDWKQEGTGWVLSFRSDGKASKSWGTLTPEWKVKGGVVLVEKSRFRPSPSGDAMVSTNGRMAGRWVRLK